MTLFSFLFDKDMLFVFSKQKNCDVLKNKWTKCILNIFFCVFSFLLSPSRTKLTASSFHTAATGRFIPLACVYVCAFCERDCESATC